MSSCRRRAPRPAADADGAASLAVCCRCRTSATANGVASSLASAGALARAASSAIRHGSGDRRCNDCVDGSSHHDARAGETVKVVRCENAEAVARHQTACRCCLLLLFCLALRLRLALRLAVDDPADTAALAIAVADQSAAVAVIATAAEKHGTADPGASQRVAAGQKRSIARCCHGQTWPNRPRLRRVASD